VESAFRKGNRYGAGRPGQRIIAAMDAALWAEIKRLHGIEKIAIAEIARRLHRDRKTVRQAVRSERVPARTPAAPRPSILEPYKPYIVDRLKAYPRLPAAVLFYELKKQGYLGQVRIVRKLVHELRGKTPEVFLRIETPPGEQAQCDWANCGSVQVGNIRRNLSAFVMVLSHSRLMYVEFTLSQCLEDFIQCHINAFRVFGGVPKKILYDNLKTVVLSRLGSTIRFNPAFMEFSGVFGFEPVPCNVARGNEKGKVENGIYYLRINFLQGREPVWPDINRDVHLWLRDVANVRIHRTTRQRPVDVHEREKPFLIALPLRDYDAAITQPVRSSHQALVRFQGNFYSVPYTQAYKTLTLKADATQVRILFEAKEIASHSRSYDRGAVIEKREHYEGILSTKRRHFHNILHKRFLELGPTAKTFLEGLIQAEVHPARHLQKLLNLVATYGKDDVLSAMDHAASCNAYGVNYVENILLQRRAAQGLPEIRALDIPQRPDWNDLTTEDPDLSVYDQALEKPSKLPRPPSDEDDPPAAVPL
jgi:transposase